MSDNIKFSIIIPVKEINDYIRESIPKILELDYKGFEIIILPNDNNIPFQADKTQIVSSGKVGPAQKRNMGANIAKGEILAFLDDDAYPRKDWLDNVLKYFDDENVVSVGGPGITPLDDPFRARVSGAVYLTKIGGGNPDRYIPYGSVKQIDDWPSVNLFVRKKEFLDIGGFDNDYWPGEDTKLSENLVYGLGKKMLYAPDVIVWHHRRPGFMKHLDQVGKYGLHRGFFFKKGDKNSKRFLYLVPSCFVLYLFGGFVLGLLCDEWVFKLYLMGLGIYVLGLVVGAIDIYMKIKDFSIAFFAIFYIVFTHIIYGMKFIQGFFTSNLISKLR